jgi:hypothetical protein
MFIQQNCLGILFSLPKIPFPIRASFGSFYGSFWKYFDLGSLHPILFVSFFVLFSYSIYRDKFFNLVYFLIDFGTYLLFVFLHIDSIFVCTLKDFLVQSDKFFTMQYSCKRRRSLTD